ncbi:hypothetical protein AGMMS49521_2640 [Campylobacterota bacterium]|nr:hypothetical protein AGMMS49521_2640 [Campylobacterota bacterium]GHV07959.1 hypothetical protein AGMMS50229_15610 [Campylobacterota bacterium]
MQPYIDGAELQQIIKQALDEATVELRDEGITLNVSCDYENGNHSNTDALVQRIKNNAYNAEDQKRFDYISAALED